MSDANAALHMRQWVSLPGGSCDVRLGTSVLDECGSVLKGAIGRPRIGALVYGDTVDAELIELMRRQMTSVGFEVKQIQVPSGSEARTVEASSQLFSGLSEAMITADDLVVTIGDTDVLSLASYACALWCGGVALVMVALNQTGIIEGALTPRGIAVGARDGVLTTRPSVKHVLFDINVALSEPADDMPIQPDEDTLMARVLMVVTAMCDSESAFSRLWDRSEDLCAGNREVICEQLRDTAKTRGKILSSTALALRQSLSYGEAFASALMRLLGESIAPSTARAEALRFQARLAAGDGLFEVDDVFAQDELLERLELPVLAANVDPDELVKAVREERFARSNRFLLGLPRKLGRVRLAAVTDERIAEHVAAWCASRAV